MLKKGRLPLFFLFASILLLTYGIGRYVIKTKVVSEELFFIAEVQLSKADWFQLFYEVEGGFKEEQSIRQDIEAGEQLQQVRFDLPLNTTITRLRFDIGANKEQKEIKIARIIIGNEHKTVVIDSLKSFFSANDCIKYTRDPTILTTTEFLDIYDPYFISGDVSAIIDDLNKTGDSFSSYVYAALISCVLCFALFLNIPLISCSKTPEVIFAVIFFVILVAPTSDQFFNLFPDDQNIEKRTLAEKPEFSFSLPYARDFEKYYDDQFGFRNLLIGWNSFMKISMFHSSINPEKVQFGKNGWLFYNEKQVFVNYTHLDLLDDEGLHSVTVNFEYRAKLATERGAQAYFAFWPNKHTIYQELMPFSMRSQVLDTLSKMDQLIAYLKDRSFVELMDVRATLLKEKDKYPLYYKFDTHWNAYGAFFSYQELLRQMGKTPETLDDFDVKWQPRAEGDLIYMLGRESIDGFVESDPVFIPKDTSFSFEKLPVDGYPGLTTITRNENAVDTTKLLLFGDSYLETLIQFFSGHFKEVTYIRVSPDVQFIDKVQPDIVIEAVVERIR